MSVGHALVECELAPLPGRRGVPPTAAAALMALGARQSPTLAMHGPQTQWPTTLENDKKKEKFRERH